MKVLIATPAYGGLVHTTYHDSVFRTVNLFAEEFPGIRFDSKILSISLLTVARNVFASLVLNDSSYTHLLFIDADMGFSPSLVAKMLAFRKPVVGIVAPARKLDCEALYKARSISDNALTARLIANEYIAGDGAVLKKTFEDGSREIDVVDGFVRVSHTGTGIMLIERQVLEKMRDQLPDLWTPNPPEHVRKIGLPKGGYLQCFEALRDKDNIAMGEDVSFCQRWVKECGGEIWANVDEAIAHIGLDTFFGQYITKMKQDKTVHLHVTSSSGAPVGAPVTAPPLAPVVETRAMNRKERRAMRHSGA